MILEGARGFRREGIGEPGAADPDQGLQGMGETTQVFALALGELRGLRAGGVRWLVHAGSL